MLWRYGGPGRTLVRLPAEWLQLFDLTFQLKMVDFRGCF
jgi:hypothetical protein